MFRSDDQSECRGSCIDRPGRLPREPWRRRLGPCDEELQNVRLGKVFSIAKGRIKLLGD